MRKSVTLLKNIKNQGERETNLTEKEAVETSNSEKKMKGPMK